MSKEVLDSVISLISPSLAPHSPAPLTFPHLVKLFTTLLSSQKDEIVSFVGDSSGGNIVLAVMLETLKINPRIKSPANLMLIAPVVDLRFGNSKIREVQKHDPVLRLPIEMRTAKSWADSWDLSDRRLSPVLADLTSFDERRVKVHGLTGGYDILTLIPCFSEESAKQLGYLENGWNGRSRCIAFQSLSHMVSQKVLKERIGSLMY